MNARGVVGARILRLIQHRTIDTSKSAVFNVARIDLDTGRSVVFGVAELEAGYAVLGYNQRSAPCDDAAMNSDRPSVRLRLDVHDRRGSAVAIDSGAASVGAKRTLARAVADRVSRATGRSLISLELLSRGESEARYLVTIGTRDGGTPKPDGWFQLAVTESHKDTTK